MGRKWMYIVGSVAVLFIIVFLFQKYRVAPAVNFEKLRLSDADGRSVSFSQWNGKKKIVCFSASWCPNCRMELKDIYRVIEDLPGVEVLVISDEPLDKIQEFRSATGYPFTFLKLEQIFPEIGINSIPVSYVLNTHEEVKKETVGYIDWKDPSTREHLKALME